MCGIAGIILGDSKKTSSQIDEMLSRIVHRGPDDEGTFVDEKVAVGMRRLSIIDVAHGKQPISSMDGSLVIVFNGEIYNFKELREGLMARGHHFKTHTDTEVILHLYEEHGENAVNELRGMFTFELYDIKKGKVLVARDPFGIKPLYYWRQGGVVHAVASEIKSILALPGYKPTLNEEGVFHYLSYQYNPLRETLFAGIYRLPPGSYLIIDAATGNAEEKRYHEFVFSENPHMDEEEGIRELSRVMADSVEHHLISEVPLGAFLSGGIDSALIVSSIRKAHPTGELKTFTIGGKEGNEFAAARPTAELLNTTHTEIVLDPEEYFSELPKIAWHFDEPVADPSAVALYFLAREASKHVKVVLSGEGADELFGGYNIYREPFALSALDRLPRFLRAPLLALGKLPFEMWGLNYLRRHATPLEERYIGNAKVFSHAEARSLWRKKSYKRNDTSGLFKEVVARHWSPSTAMQYVDINTWLPGDILAKADKMTMAHSLELRVPFLDAQVAAFAATIPDTLKYKNGTTKYLLRRAAEGLIPPQTQARKKLGFPVPLAEWLRKRTDWQEKLLNHAFLNEYLHHEGIERIIHEHMSGRRDRARKIFVLLMLATWHDVYFGGKPHGEKPL